MSFSAVYSTIETRLNTITTLPTLQTENTRVKLGSGATPWCRLSILPARSDITSVGPNGFSRLNGIAQVDLFYPEDSGYSTSIAMGDTVLAKFIPGTILTGAINIENSYLRSPQNVLSGDKRVPNYFMTSVMIEWSLFEQRATIT